MALFSKSTFTPRLTRRCVCITMHYISANERGQICDMTYFHGNLFCGKWLECSTDKGSVTCQSVPMLSSIALRLFWTSRIFCQLPCKHGMLSLDAFEQSKCTSLLHVHAKYLTVLLGLIVAVYCAVGAILGLVIWKAAVMVRTRRIQGCWRTRPMRRGRFTRALRYSWQDTSAQHIA